MVNLTKGEGTTKNLSGIFSGFMIKEELTELVEQSVVASLFNSGGDLANLDLSSLGENADSGALVKEKAKTILASIFKNKEQASHVKALSFTNLALNILKKIEETTFINFKITEHALDFAKAIVSVDNDTKEEVANAVISARLQLEAPLNEVLYVRVDDSNNFIISGAINALVEKSVVDALYMKVGTSIGGFPNIADLVRSKYINPNNADEVRVGTEKIKTLFATLYLNFQETNDSDPLDFILNVFSALSTINANSAYGVTYNYFDHILDIAKALSNVVGTSHSVVANAITQAKFSLDGQNGKVNDLSSKFNKLSDKVNTLLDNLNSFVKEQRAFNDQVFEFMQR